MFQAMAYQNSTASIPEPSVAAGSEIEQGSPVRIMPSWSRFAGQPIDTSSLHSLQIIDALSQPDRWVVDYIYHLGTYWRAAIPVNGVEQVLAQCYNFSNPRTKWGTGGKEILRNRNGAPRRRIPVLNHLQARFVFRPDQTVKLYSLDSDHSSEAHHELDDLVYSVEAVGPPGYTYSLRNAMGGHLVTAHRFVSMQEMAFERLVTEDQYLTESPPLPLTEHQKRQMLIETIQRSDRAGMTEPYYLLRLFGTNNCASNPLQILDNVVDYSRTRRLSSALYRLPLNPRLYLRMRGMDSDPSVRKLVCDEFHDFIHDPRTQQRKEEVFAKKKVAQDSNP